MDISNQRESYLDLAVQAIEQQHDTFLYLDKKAWQLISVSSIVIALVAAFNLDAILDPSVDVPREVLWFLGAATLCYAVAFISALLVVSPTTFTYPFTFDWDTARSIDEKDVDGYYEWLIAGLSKCIEDNEESLKQKARGVKMGTNAIGLTIIFIILAVVSAAIL